MSTIQIQPVVTSSDRTQFIKFLWKIYEGNPNWVPPLLWDVGRKLDRGHNPYFEHAEAEYFIAWRGKDPVGRISAQIDQNYDKHWGGKTGHFGFFEALDDPGVAKALFLAAGDWLKRKGRDQIQGPYNFNINDD